MTAPEFQNYADRFARHVGTELDRLGVQVIALPEDVLLISDDMVHFTSGAISGPMSVVLDTLDETCVMIAQKASVEKTIFFLPLELPQALNQSAIGRFKDVQLRLLQKYEIGRGALAWRLDAVFAAAPAALPVAA